MNSATGTRLFGALTIFATFMILPSLAIAVQSVTSCDFECSQNCELTEDLVCCTNEIGFICDGNGPILLKSGVNLDLNGYRLESICGNLYCSGDGGGDPTRCFEDSDCPASETCDDRPQCNPNVSNAVKMDTNGSEVKNTGGNHGTAGILGPFQNGVWCQGKTSSEVTGIRILGSKNAITQCAKSEKNVLIGNFDTGQGVTVVGIANSDFIRNNYIEGFRDAVVHNGTTDIDIADNVIVLGPGYAVSGIGGGSNATIEDNFLMGEGKTGGFAPTVINSTSTTISDNVCDSAHEDCDDCKSDGDCLSPDPPFVKP